MGHRSPVPETGRGGQGIRLPDHDRAVALHPARATRTQLSKTVETTKEQMVKATSRLTPTTASKTGPKGLLFSS